MTNMLLRAALICSGCVAALPASAQQTVPDFSPDATVGWLASGTEYIAMPTGPHPVTPDPAHPYVLNGRRGQPTLRVADLDNPILQPWVKEALRKVNERTLSGKGDNFPPQVRCWPLGVPAFLLYPAQPIYIVQTPKEVVMTWQSDHMVRHIFLTDRHSANPKPSWFGESIGHYEGDTLVIDTIGLNTKTFVDNYRTPHSDKLHVVERYRMANAETRLEVTVTVDDPGAFTTPWSARQVYRRIEVGPMGESTCIEGNFNYFNFDLDPLPTANQADF